MKKLGIILTVFLLVGLLFALLATQVSAETISGTCDYDLTWTFDTDTGVLEITGTGQMYYSSCPWYSYRDSIKSVCIGDGVRDIKSGAFQGCTALTSISIPDSVTYIGEKAFYNTGYYNDESNWTAGVLYIGKCLIKAKNLTGDYAIKDGTRHIASKAFDGCSELKSVTMPDSVTSIGESSFYKCTGLTSVTIPDSVTSIGSYAFSGCTALTSLTIPDSVTSVGVSAVANTAYYNNEENWKNGYLYCGKWLLAAREKSEEITMQKETVGIADGVFQGWVGVTSVTFPDSLTSIGNFAFSGCTGLRNLTIPDSVLVVGKAAFSDCNSLQQATIGNALKEIPDKAFQNCVRLKEIVVPNAIERIGEYAFSGCSQLKTAVLGNGVKEIGAYAFSSCIALGSDITIPSSVTHIGEEAFEGCSSLTRIMIDDLTAWCRITFDSAGANPISASSSDTNLYVNGKAVYPSGVLQIPDGITTINPYAFCEQDYANHNVRGSLILPDSVEVIGVSAFQNNRFGSIQLGNGLRIIEAYAFCTVYDSRPDLLIPDSVVEIGAYAFARTNCVRIRLGNHVESIGNYAFWKAMENSDGIQSYVVLPESVKTVGYQAFGENWRLKDVLILNPTCKILGGEWTFGVMSSGSTKAKIHGYAFSTADDYAIKYNYQFSELIPCEFYHDWGETTYEWAADNSSVTATHTCKDNASHVETETVKTTSKVTKEATYEEEGEITYTATFSKSAFEAQTKTVATPKLEKPIPSNPCEDGHEYVAVVTAPTCTKNGYTTYTCSRCGDSYKDNNTKALGHNFKNGVCTRCGKKDPDYKPEDPTEPTTAPTEPTEPTETTPVTPTNFNDVARSAWYYEAVNYAVSHGLMNGVGNNNFAPDAPMTRAMLVTVLWRYEGEKQEGTNGFTDVPAGQWYTDAVAWAAQNGIVGGVGNGKFDPNGNITREQMAAILFRYASGKGFDTSKRGDLSGFPDAGKVSDWAKDAISWAVAEGIIGGSDGKLLPQGNATRAQVSTILMRFIEGIAKK